MNKEITSLLQKLPKGQKEKIDDLLKSFDREVNKSASILQDNIISNIPANGICINRPGKYTFSKNVIFKPEFALSAITIISKDVELDMRGFQLSCKTDTEGSFGIHVLESENITIKNGIIKNMSLNSVYVDKSKNIEIKDLTCLNLTNNNVKFEPAGIQFVKCENVFVKNIYINNINSIGVTVAGISFILTKKTSVNKAQINNLSNRDGVVTGIRHFLSQNSIIKNVEVKELTTDYIGSNLEGGFGHTCIGMYPFISKNLMYKNCKVSDIKGSCDDAHGMSMFIVSKANIINCKVNRVSSGTEYLKCAKATGIELYGSNIQVENCIVDGVETINPQNKQCVGFSVAAGSNLKIVNCKAKNINVFNEKMETILSNGFGIGFGYANDPREFLLLPVKKVIYTKCQAEKCQVGFDSFNHLQSKWKDIFSLNNAIPIMNNIKETRIITCDPCSECPVPLITQVNNVSNDNTFQNIDIKYNKK